MADTLPPTQNSKPKTCSEVPTQTNNANRPLLDLARLFLKLGTIAFGGPAAHIAMMEDEVVRRLGWLTREEFLDLLGATNLIPGPNSTEMAIFIGYRRAGFPGLIAAGTCFIIPALLIVLACAWAYVRFGTLPQVAAILYGVKPVIIAIVLQAIWGLGKSAIKSGMLAFIAVGAVISGFLGVNELLLLLVAGIAAALLRQATPGASIAAWAIPQPLVKGWWAAAVPAGATAVKAAAAATPVSLTPLFLFFLKVGSVLYGSGYVLLAFLRNGLVEQYGWLTESQLLDAVAVGQFTPGPVFTTATFIGYLLGGLPAAMAATAGIFLPAFFFVAISGPLVPRMRRSRVASGFLDGVNVASLALMAMVSFQLGRAALVDGLTMILAMAALFLLMRYRINSAWLVGAGMATGLVKYILA